jgi:hypothetical protein
MWGPHPRLDQRALPEDVQIPLETIGFGLTSSVCLVDARSEASGTPDDRAGQTQRRVDRRDERLPGEIGPGIIAPVLVRESDWLRAEPLLHALPTAAENAGVEQVQDGTGSERFANQPGYAGCGASRVGLRLALSSVGRRTDPCASVNGGSCRNVRRRNEIVEHARRRDQIFEHAVSQSRRIDAVVAQPLDHRIAWRAAVDRVSGSRERIR